MKYKLHCLGKSLSMTSSLNVEGRIESAISHMKSTSQSLKDAPDELKASLNA